VSYPLTVNDACPQDVVVTCDTPSGASFGAGSKTVHCTANNGCSQTQCTFQVNVTSSCPTLACPADATVPLGADACLASPTFDAVLSDPCTGTAATNVPHTFVFAAPGSQTFTYQAGGQSCTQTVTAVDHTPPTITTQAIAPVQACGTQSAAVQLPIPQACDACSPATPSTTCHNPVGVTGTIVSRNGSPVSIAVPPSGTVSLAAGTYVVSWTATDASGNTSTVTQTFSVSGPPPAPPWNGGQTYHAGDRVSFGGFSFEARQTNTGVQPVPPGSATPDATLAIWDIPTPCGITPWQDETHYLPGSMVTYQGVTYVCITANYAVFNWTPDVVPALWRRARPSDVPICPCP
jgi:hypothetical protein